ncbi:MAG: SCO family protein [Gammaproteobacteria bacterium]|nr:SCO family protein [Gammaproteobacteria bacterium]
MSSQKYAKFSIFALAGVALAVGLWLGWKMSATPPSRPPEISGVLFPEPRPIAPFALIDQHSAPFTLDRLKGKWSFLFFGYTHCPDVCPTTLSLLNAAYKQLAQAPQDRDNVHVVFVTVDPERDTPRQLAQYVGYFNKDFIGLTSRDPAQILTLTRQLGILSMKVANPSGGGYLVDHSAVILLVDPGARVRAMFSPPYTAQAIAAGFRKIRQYYGTLQ